MPPELPAKSAVTIQQIDSDTWLVKRQKEDKKVVFIAIPMVERLPDDPEWDKVEEAFGRHSSNRLPVPEE